ncbi:MAG: hypothetical protein BGO70_00345 [Bacteroidetes bacterium 43-93]|nr:MAG: hypothetical protein BGO70_00345 [Bacteroidetes bacterium 43-93]
MYLVGKNKRYLKNVQNSFNIINTLKTTIIDSSMTKNGIIFAIFISNTIRLTYLPVCSFVSAYEALSRLRDYELNKDL